MHLNLHQTLLPHDQLLHTQNNLPRHALRYLASLLEALHHALDKLPRGRVLGVGVIGDDGQGHVLRLGGDVERAAAFGYDLEAARGRGLGIAYRDCLWVSGCLQKAGDLVGAKEPQGGFM